MVVQTDPLPPVRYIFDVMDVVILLTFVSYGVADARRAFKD